MNKLHYITPDLRVSFCEYLHEWNVEIGDEYGWEKLITFFNKEDAVTWARNRNDITSIWFDL